MLLPRQFCSVAIFGLFIASLANAADHQDLGGLILGGPFEAAQQHALEQGWKLEPLSDHLPGQWAIEEERLSLFTCNGRVASISKQLEGDLEEFTARVFSMQLEYGKPDTQILSLNSGVGVTSTIDARFSTENGGATVQLQSISGKRTFWVSHWIEIDCN